MKVLFAVHGFPPELVGGTELSVRTLAENCLALGHEVVVVAGSMQWEQGFRTSTEVLRTEAGALTVHRIHRADLYFDHWHKGREPRVAAAFAQLLERERPDLVHVHHWVRLTDDLVATAARAGVPAAVSLHDLWSTCPLTFRVRPDTRAFCSAAMAPDPCVGCAAVLPPPTPWVDRDQAGRLLEARREAIGRELALARAVLCPSRAHAQAIAGLGGFGPIEPELVPPGVDLRLARRDPLPAPGRGRPLSIGVWGHLAPLKGVDLVLEAVRSLPDPRAVRVEIAGGEVDAEHAARLRALAEGLDVRFHGAYEAAALDSHPVTNVHLMVSGTRAHESWGLVLDEALLLGLPALVPRSGAFVERMEGQGFARTYESGDSHALADALGDLLARPAELEAMRAALPPPDRAVHSGREHALRTLEVYSRVVAAGPPPVESATAEERGRELAALEAWDRACRGGS